MWPYILLNALVAVTALLAPPATAGRGEGERGQPLSLAWGVAWATLILFVGLRYEVGGEWFAYGRYFEVARYYSFWEAVSVTDPGFMTIAWLSVWAGVGLIGANVAFALIFVTGVVVFCRAMPRPWLALCVASPYMILVLGMGYSRQGVALGLVLVALVAWLRRQKSAFYVWMLLAATFHKTAIVLVPLIALSQSRDRLRSLVLGGAVFVMAYLVLLADSLDKLMTAYVEREMQSEGALVRLAMNGVPAVLFLLWQRRFGFEPLERDLWRWFSVVSLVLLAALFFLPASTAIDRIALYLLPLQLVIFSRLPNAASQSRLVRNVVNTSIVLYYFVVLVVWLNFAANAEAWLPYRSFLLEDVL